MIDHSSKEDAAVIINEQGKVVVVKDRIGGWASGSYYITCLTCNKIVPDCDKRAISCRPCALLAIEEQIDNV